MIRQAEAICRVGFYELAGDDLDLLLEIVRFQETRDYIRFIYEIYNTYRTLYSSVQ